VSPKTPLELRSVLDATTDVARTRAWQEFAAAYSRVILHAIRSVHRDHDAVMDAYAFALQKLRDDDLRRLRAFCSTGTGKFTTWLVVVARRLAHDWHRQAYGRPSRPEDEESRMERQARRRLVDLASEAIDLAGFPDASDGGTDARVMADEIRAALAAEIEALPPADRLLLRLRFEDGLAAKQIATVTKAPSPFHVYRRVNHVLALLRQRLVARGVESPIP
jgi:RNA polymerase sigma factor (sigma-70 family)